MLLSNPERIAIETVAAALEPPPALDLLDWAERNIVFDDGPFPGPYSRALFPFFDEVLRALGPDNPCRIVSMSASAQVGKTALATIFALGSMTASRGSFMVVHPTQDNAIRWSKMKLAPMIRSTRDRARDFPAARQRSAGVDPVPGTQGRAGPTFDHGREQPGQPEPSHNRRAGPR